MKTIQQTLQDYRKKHPGCTSKEMMDVVKSYTAKETAALVKAGKL
jgi:hypothetical protein